MSTATRPRRTPKKWIRNASDERAVRDGYWFEEKKGQDVVDWIHDYCCLYEGVPPGTPMRLDDWQYDATMRLFGWVHDSDEYGGEVRRFRRAGIWVPKKNGKSPTLAAWGLYLFLGDGESGQKVFSAARDGVQAKIAHQHAIEMVRMSPALSRECEINKSTGQISHPATGSSYRIIAGDNFKGQEGINGCVLIDETHVVDRRLAKVVRFAGASRREPLHIEVSTAGNDPDGYGKEQYDYGKRVESGEFQAPGFLFICHEAPQDTPPEALDNPKDVIRLGKLANPSWGRIVRESEFVESCQESRDSKSKRLDFLMYRLNVWQQSVNPWLSLDQWKRCEKPFSIEDLRGRECWAGLDMARTQDLNALALCFPEPEGVYRFLWWFWLPEETARQKNHLAPFVDWAADPRNNLTLAKGSAVHHEIIVKKFLELSKIVSVKQLWFDNAGAEWASRAIAEGLYDEKGTIIAAGANIERIEHPQGKQAFHEPTEKFESLVVSGKMIHNGSPIMSWQIGHASIAQNEQGHKKPVKPDGKDGIKKVDGPIAGIMALSGAMKAERNDSVYESRGLFVLGGEESDYDASGDYIFDRDDN